MITRILINEREGRRVRRHGSKGSRGQSDVTAASGHGRKLQTKECGQSLKVGKGREQILPWKLPEGMQA